MRRDSHSPNSNLHWHDGGTCHGSPTLELCAVYAIENRIVGKILEREDQYEYGGPTAKCYSLVIDHFDHWARQGKFVGETVVVLKDELEALKRQLAEKDAIIRDLWETSNA